MSPDVIQSLALFGVVISCVVLCYGLAWSAFLGIALLGISASRITALERISIPGAMMIRGSIGALDAVLGPPARRESSLGRLVRWPATWPFTRIALIYWTVGVSLALVFAPTGDDSSPSTSWEWKGAVSLWLLLAIHVWIWSSAIIDCISFNYSRNKMKRFLKHLPRVRQGNLRAIAACRALFLRDIQVATLCLFAVLLVSNHTYYFALRADADRPVAYLDVAMNPRTVLADFASYHPTQDRADVQVGTRIPGILLTALSCFVPTALWLGTAGAIVLLAYVELIPKLFRLGWDEAMRELGRTAAREHSAGRTKQWAACSGVLFSSFIGLVQLLPVAFPM